MVLLARVKLLVKRAIFIDLDWLSSTRVPPTLSVGCILRRMHFQVPRSTIIQIGVFTHSFGASIRHLVDTSTCFSLLELV